MYSGETQCVAFKGNGTKCTNLARFEGGLCGVHGKGRNPLPVNPYKDQIKQNEIDLQLQGAIYWHQENKKAGMLGVVSMVPMRMRRKVDYQQGSYCVFPNKSHGNRKDAIFDTSSLSPFNLGPVIHNEKDFPPASCVENYFQFSKIWPDESWGEFTQTRWHMFQQPGQRHKRKGSPPRCALYQEPDGSWNEYTYVQSRKKYCFHYQQLAVKDPAFLRLFQLRCDGGNITIYGFDSFPFHSGVESIELMKQHYNDPSKPFGHEAVLCCMLIMDFKDYPWHA